MQRKQYSAQFKAKIALEAVKGLKTINEIASESGVYPTQKFLTNFLRFRKRGKKYGYN
jgi:transposase-like protein